MSKNDEKTKVTKKVSNETKSNNVSKTAKKQTSPKKITVKKSTTNKSNTKKSTSKGNTTVTKPRTKTIKKDVDKVIEKDIAADEIKIEKKEENIKDKIVEQDNIEKEIIEEVTNINSAKIENAKFTIRKKNKLAISIGVFVSLLGIIALIITLIANRIIDREFISDTEIIFMVIISIVIEIMGAAIIVKET